tara:strand:+ start:533 stop:922 length:390 start_codon:yes stop_codon:yes gene_type:complete
MTQETNSNTHYLTFFPSAYLRAADLENAPDTVGVVIAGLSVEAVTNNDGKEERLPVLHFNGTEKGLILNRTNADTVAGLHGPNVEAWTGKRIGLFIQRGVKAFGGIHDVIRIRNTVPAAPAHTPEKDAV